VDKSFKKVAKAGKSTELYPKKKLPGWDSFFSF